MVAAPDRPTCKAESEGASRSVYLQVEVPPHMAKAVQRHHTTLSSFAANLNAAGVDQTLAAQSIREMIDSYRTELVAAVGAHREQSDGR